MPRYRIQSAENQSQQNLDRSQRGKKKHYLWKNKDKNYIVLLIRNHENQK